MRAEHAESLGIKTISDIVRYQDELQPGFDAEFFVRPDGYPGLKKKYDLSFKKSPRQMIPGIMYKALAEKSVDVICGYRTDGRIPAYDLIVLKDDKNFFPPYYAAPLIRKETLLKYPELKKVINKIGGIISNQTMQKLNYKVDNKEQSASGVAQKFLEDKGLIRKN
jgi:glycine betaine/choline ABC-type transport system substrate-binding protein